MNTKYKDFIGIYSDVYPEGYCQHLIEEFERLCINGAGANRQQSESALRHKKDDFQIGMNIKHHSPADFKGHSSVDIFFEGLQRCYDTYSEKYSVLHNAGRLRATQMKMQRTSEGGGYHVWHCEQGGEANANRAVVYMLYLNTLPKGGNGETEFLYQHLRIDPEENTMILWPAAYTHAHRGNPVYGNTSKYIVTGWFYYD